VTALLRRLLIACGALAALALLAWLTSAWWAGGIPRLLVDDEGPRKADLAVVLAGDYSGQRILRAGELVRQGLVPAALVSGPEYYGLHECDMAIDFAVKRGCAREWFLPFPNSAESTRDEAKLVFPELERRGVRSFLLVTSDYHTARAARIFRAEGKARRSTIEVHPVAAYHRERDPGGWWRTREGRKTVVLESIKTIATALGS
jgi:uncharacterized SAM-binding protein YcdF (DUF218 family)